MEGLIELVAASFIRHGIESPPVGDSLTSQTIRPAEPTLTTGLLEHNRRTIAESDPAP
jgi:hypothetical protein